MSTKNVKNTKEGKDVEGTNVKTETSLVVVTQPELPAEEKNKLLEAEIEKLKAKLNAVPQDFESKVEYFREKQVKIKKLQSYEFNLKQLEEYAEQVKSDTEEEEIEGENFLMQISKKSYPERTVLKINNPVLIGEVINYIIDKIDAKIEILRTEIAM